MDQALPMVMELNQKIDLLTTQVQFLTEQAQRAERERQERAELMRDVMPIVNDAFRLTVEQLEEVQGTSNWTTCCASLNGCCAMGATSKRCLTNSKA